MISVLSFILGAVGEFLYSCLKVGVGCLVIGLILQLIS